MKCWMGSNSGQIWPVTLESHALELRKNYVSSFSRVIFDKIYVKLAGNEDRHKISNEFKFGPDRIIHFGVICP